MREVMASPNSEPDKEPDKDELTLPGDSEADAILQFEIEPRDPDDAEPVPTAEDEPPRVTPFPTVVHHKAPVAAEPAPVPEAAPPSKPRNWRNAVLILLAAVVLTQGALMTYWMLSRGGGAAITPATGSVTITSEPAGSAVAIDGAGRGQTPLTIALTSGAHLIVVGTGEVARSQNINVTGGGQSSVHVQLPSAVSTPAAAPGGTLQIATEPPGARVWVDGKPRGTAPLTIADLGAGDHAVSVRADGGDLIKRTVTVRDGATASLVVTMPGTGASAPGWLAISSEVALQVMEKGELLGTTEMSRILLPPGAHELELVNPALGYRSTRSVTIAGGQTAAFTVVRPRGTLSVNALPWAEVWIDGQRAGETPIGNYSIPIGTHELLFRHPELGEQRKTVTIGAQGPVRVGVDMKKP